MWVRDESRCRRLRLCGLDHGGRAGSLGHEVCCIDTEDDRIETIQRGRAPFFEPGLDDLLIRQLGAGRFRATTDLAEGLAGTEVSFIAVGTPSLSSGEIDLGFVEAAAGQIGDQLPELPPGHVVVVKSTVVPGTTRGLVGPILERRSKLPKGGFGLCANPEFLREGSAVEDFLHPDRILLGAADAASAARLQTLYASFDCPVLVTSPDDAEMTKYASNALLATLISFSNEIAGLCEGVPGTDVETVLAALRLDRRLSPVQDGVRMEPGILDYLRAGSGYGGSCLPKDIAALRAFAQQRGRATSLLDAVSHVNAERPAQLLATLEEEIGSCEGRCRPYSA